MFGTMSVLYRTVYALWWLCVVGVSALGGYPRPSAGGPRDGGDPGSPLILTPLVDAGNTTLAKKLARVSATDPLHIESYSGFLTVDRVRKANLFFWYFPALSGAVDAPLIVWLQGGPGASSLFGLFEEHGPVRAAVGGKLARRRITWARHHDIVYFDSPVGTGFSFSENSDSFCRDENCVGQDLHAALLQLVKIFPELHGRPLFVTGESYGGKYVPALSHCIHSNPDPSLKLSGIAIGNGLTDPKNQLLYSKYLYQHGLLDNTQQELFATQEEKVRDAIRAQDFDEAFRLFDSLLNGDLIKGQSMFYNMTGYEYYFNILLTRAPSTKDSWTKLFDSSDMRRALHVGSRPLNNGSDVERALLGDVMRSVAPLLAELLAHYRVLVYNGQLDIIVAYPLTENYLQQLKFSGAEEYHEAPRKIWRVGSQVAGYVKTGGNLTEVLVRDSGHMVPGDQPQWALDLITRFTHNIPLA